MLCFFVHYTIFHERNSWGGEETDMSSLKIWTRRKGWGRMDVHCTYRSHPLPAHHYPESIKWFIEDQACSPSYDLAPLPPPFPLLRQQVLSLSQSSCVSAVELTDGSVGWGVGAKSSKGDKAWSCIKESAATLSPSRFRIFNDDNSGFLLFDYFLHVVQLYCTEEKQELFAVKCSVTALWKRVFRKEN